MGLTREQIEVVRKEAEKYKAAVAEVSHAQVALWQARIDMAIAVGEFDLAELLISPVASNRNCNCAAPSPGEEVMRG